MGRVGYWLRRLFGRRQGRDDRFGNRVVLLEPAVLSVCDRRIHGVIHDVGLRGVFFSAAEQPLPGALGTLRRGFGRPVGVRVVWRQGGPAAGVGLTFDSAAY